MQPYIIGIAGGSGSGKSTFIDKIEGRFGDKIAILHYDNYYREQTGAAFEQRAAMNYDHPDSLETDLLVKHLEELKRGHVIQSPGTISPSTIALIRPSRFSRGRRFSSRASSFLPTSACGTSVM